MPDKTLIQALHNAHAWSSKMKAGASMRQVAESVSRSESYIARIVPLAFISPKIQRAIVEGTQPVDLTLETLVRTKLPVDWEMQERKFGFSQNH